MTLRVGLQIVGAEKFFGGDVKGLLDIAKRADARGIDVISIGDHVVMSGTDVATYKTAPKFPLPLDQPFFEVISLMSAIAVLTKRIRLSANVLLSPLRPAVLMAKQLATLDVLSDGRVEMALGTGWQKAEYDASGIDFASRNGHLAEQVEAFRVLWSGGPASYHGKHVNFDDLYCYPLPVQGAKMPVWLGVSVHGRNGERLVRLADGWAAPPTKPDKFADDMAHLRNLCARQGRAPASLGIRVSIMPARHADGTPDPETSFKDAPALIAAGADTIMASVINFCPTAADIDPFLDRMVELKRTGR